MVRDLLDDLARDVPDYADPDRALAAARAARRRRVGAVGAVTAVALALVATMNWTHVSGPGPEWPSRLPDQTVAALPSGPTMVDLPAGAVGPARLLYRLLCQLPCSREVVELADGSRYSMSNSGDLNAPSLSPDGRLMVALFDRRSYLVRDLARDAAPQAIEPPLEAGRWQPSAWSPDNRWLVMWSPHGQSGSEYARVDLVGHTVVTYQPPAGMYAIAALPSGELVLAPGIWAAVQPLQVVDPATGATRSLPTVDTRPWLAPGERIRHDPTSPALVSADGGRLGVQVRSGDRVAALLEIDLATGGRIGWHELGADPGWEPVAYSGGGVAVVARRPTRTGVLDLATGAVAETSTLPASASVLVPGGYSWYG